MPLTASMEAPDPPEDAGGSGSQVMCPDGSWHHVVEATFTGEFDHPDFEVAVADPSWVADVEGLYCFSWLEFQAWAQRIGYDYEFALDGDYPEGMDVVATTVLWCQL